MRFSGTRRARAITFFLSLLLLLVLWQAGQLYVRRVLGNLGPALLAQAQESLGREIQVDKLQIDRPGYILIEGLRVARGRRMKEGVQFSARRVEVSYDPALVAWSTLTSGIAGRNTRARLQAYGVRLYAAPGSPIQEVLTSETLRTSFDLAPVLTRKGDLVAAVDRVDLGKPHLRLLRNRTGHWNLETLLGPTAPKKPPAFRGAVYAQDCALDLVDFKAVALPLPARNSGLFDLALRFGAYPTVQYDTTGTVAGTNGGTLHLQGHADTRNADWFLTVNARSRRLAYWYRYFAQPARQAQIETASGDVSVAVWSAGKKDPAVLFDLRADLQDGSARSASLPAPIRSYRGWLHVNSHAIALNGRAAVGEIQADVSGAASIDGRKAQFRLVSPGVTLAAIRRLAPQLKLPPDLAIPQPSRLDVAVTGGDGRWQVHADAAVPRARYQDMTLTAARVAADAVTDGKVTHGTGTLAAEEILYRTSSGRNVRATFQIADRVVQAQARLEGLGGTLQGRGWLEIGRSGEVANLYVTGRASDVDVAQLPREWLKGALPEPGTAPQAGNELTLAGTVSGDFVLSGAPADLHTSAYVRAAPLSVNKEQFQEVAGRVRWTLGGSLEIPYATVTTAQLAASVSGTVSEKGELNLRLEGRGVDLAKALAGRVKEPVEGNAFVAATVTGTLKEPRVEGRLQVYQPKFRDFGADYVEGEFLAADTRHVQVSGLNLNRGLAHATADRLAFTLPEGKDQEWHVEGNAEVTGLSVVRALQLAGMSLERIRQEGLAGDLGPVRLALRGPASAPAVQFEASSPSLTARGVELRGVAAKGSIDAGSRTVEVASLNAAALGAAAALRGAVRLDPKAKPDQVAAGAMLDLSFSLEGIDLHPVLRRYAPDLLKSIDVRGSVTRVEGTLRGTGEAPELSADARFGNLLVNDRAVQVDPLHVEWNPGAALVRGLKAHLGSGSVEVPYLIALLDEKSRARPLEERVAGVVQVHGIPIAAVRQLVEDSPYYDTPQAEGLRETLEAWRTPLRGAISADVSLPNHLEEAPRPQTVAEVPRFFQQAMNRAPLAGTLHIPELRLAEEGDSPPAELTSAFLYADNRLDLTQLRLEWEGALVSARGYYRTVKAPDDQVWMEGQVTGLRLASLSRLPLPGLQQRLDQLQPFDGELRMDAEVTGTGRKPEARFSLDVARPVIAGLPFDELSLKQGAYSAAEQRLILGLARLARKGAEGEKGGEVLLSGWLPIGWPRVRLLPDAERSVTVELPEQSLGVFLTLANEAEKLQQNTEAVRRLRPLAGALRRLAAVEGTMRGKVTLGGTDANPRNSGTVSFASAALRVENVQTEIRDFRTDISLQGNVVSVDRFQGRSSVGGGFAGSGTLRLGGDAPRLLLALDIDRFRFSEKKIANLVGKEFRGTQVEATLQTVDKAGSGRAEPLRIAGEWPSPRITGAIEVDQANLVTAFATLPDRGAFPLPGNPELDVDIRTGKSVWVRNSQVRLKLDGSVHAGNTLQEPVVTGRLDVSRGTLTLPLMPLRNLHGYIRVAYDPTKPDFQSSATPIYLDLTASTTLRLQRSAALEPEYYDTTFRIQGTPRTADGRDLIRPVGVGSALTLGQEGGLTLMVSTDPPLPRGQIEALIRQQFGVEGIGGAGNNVVEALSGQIEQALAANVVTSLTAPFENAIQSALGLDIFSLDLGITQPLRVRIGKRLFGNLFGTVTQEFSTVTANQRRFEVYYRLTPQFRIGFRNESPPLGGNSIFISGAASF